MKVIVVGTGFVGLTHAAVLSESGHEVYAYDIDEEKITAFGTGERKTIERYVHEPGLSEIVAETLNRYLFFVNKIDDFIEGTEIIFFCLPTPPNLDGSTDLSAYKKAAHHLAPLLATRTDQRRVVLVNKSTVPIGTTRLLQRIMQEYNVPNFGVASNPEFLPEGEAVDKSRRPDRVVIGADTEDDFKILRRLYARFYNHVRIAYRETTPETAEAIKYVSNTLLLTYISFWNGIGARLGETFDNVNIEDLKRGVTADDRISTWGSYVSNGAGGSCFGKDIQSLIYQFRQQSQSTKFLEEVYIINEYQKSYLIDRTINEAKFNFNNKSVALLGMAFKKQTNDMRDSSALVVAETLLARGVKSIQAYDPLATEEAKRYFDPSKNNLFEKISYYNTVQEAITNTDALFITTDWEEFRGLTGTIEKLVKPPYLVIDGRRMIADYEALLQKGYDYLAVGSKFLKAKDVQDTPDTL